MRVVIVHNIYSREGGEEMVVTMQKRLLESAGHQVYMYYRNYHEMDNWRIGKAKSMFTALKNPSAIKDIRNIVSEFKPDVAVVHNLFPIVSAAILPELHRLGIPIAMTIHNYRLFCPIGLFFRNGKTCTDCAVGHLRELHCLSNRCQGSIAGSFAFALRGAWSRIAAYYKNVDLFLSCSTFQRDNLVKYGIDKEKTIVIPNCTDFPIVSEKKEEYVAFVGRLSSEKGIDLLMEIASAMPDVHFKIAGTKAEGFCMPAVPDNVELMGFVGRDNLSSFYAKAKALIFTSRVWEAMPLTPLEAMASGTVVVANRISSLPEIIDDGKTGFLFETPKEGITRLRQLLDNDTMRTTMEKAAQQRIEEFYRPARYLDQLTDALDIKKKEQGYPL